MRGRPEHGGDATNHQHIEACVEGRIDSIVTPIAESQKHYTPCGNRDHDNTGQRQCPPAGQPEADGPEQIELFFDTQRPGMTEDRATERPAP